MASGPRSEGALAPSVRQALAALMQSIGQLLWLLLIGLPVIPVCLLLEAVAWGSGKVGLSRTEDAARLMIDWILSFALFFTSKET